MTFEIVSSVDGESESHFYCGVRSLFAIHSPVFRKMLYGQMMEADCNNTVKLPDLSRETFEFLQRCFYGLDAPLTASNVVPVLCAADQYLVSPLKNLCIRYILQLATNHENSTSSTASLCSLNVSQTDSAISLFLQSLNALFGAQQIDVIQEILTSICNLETSHCTRIWSQILCSPSWVTTHHVLVQTMLSNLLRLNRVNSRNGTQIPASKLWTQCKKWCQYHSVNGDDDIYPDDHHHDDDQDDDDYKCPIIPDLNDLKDLKDSKDPKPRPEVTSTNKEEALALSLRSHTPSDVDSERDSDIPKWCQLMRR